MRNALKPEVVPYIVRAVVTLVCLGAYLVFGKDVAEVDVGETVNMLVALFLGKELLPRAGEGK